MGQERSVEIRGAIIKELYAGLVRSNAVSVDVSEDQSPFDDIYQLMLGGCIWIFWPAVAFAGAYHLGLFLKFTIPCGVVLIALTFTQRFRYLYRQAAWFRLSVIGNVAAQAVITILGVILSIREMMFAGFAVSVLLSVANMYYVLRDADDLLDQ